MTAGRVPSEIEAKLLLPEGSDLRPLAHLQHLGRYSVRPRDVVRLHSVYFDTPDFALAYHGVALRTRGHAGHWEATAKWTGTVVGDVHERPELTVPLQRPPRKPFRPPPGPLAIRLAALIAGRPLAPILITDITRRRLDLVSRSTKAQAEPIAEVALDRVHLRGPAGVEPALTYFEVEIELRNGSRRDIAAVARVLRQRFGLRPSTQSKFARGLGLLYRRKPLAPRPTAVMPHDSLQDATRKVIATHLRRLRDQDPDVRDGQDAEALHDMRVACRRLRAAVNAFESGMPKSLYRYLKGELEWLGQLLGGVRDLDVQLQLLGRYCGVVASAPGGGLTGLQGYMESERTQRRVEVLQGIDSPRYFRLLARMEDFARGRTRSRARGTPRQPVAAVGRKAIRKAFRRLLKRGRAIDTAPTDEDLHALRIRAKRVRYLLEFLREVVGKPGRRLVKDLVRLQDLLGNHHDAVVAADFIRRYVEGPGAQASAESFLALGAFMGEQRRLADAARGDFERAWERFSRKRTVRDLGAVLRHLQPQRPAPEPPQPAAPAQAVPTGNA